MATPLQKAFHQLPDGADATLLAKTQRQIDRLLAEGHAVDVVDNLSTGKRQNLAHVSSVEFLEGDLADLVGGGVGAARADLATSH